MSVKVIIRDHPPRLLDVASNSPEAAKGPESDTMTGENDDVTSVNKNEDAKIEGPETNSPHRTDADTENAPHRTGADMESSNVDTSMEVAGGDTLTTGAGIQEESLEALAGTPPTEKKVRITTPTKSSSTKKAKKSTPWYNVLTSTYKSKSDEFTKVFKTLPENERLVADYSCALQKDILVQGRMYVTENWICFYANIFRWETVLTVPLKDVTAITKERTIRFIPNAIQVSTSTEKYFFASFMSRDKAFHLLFKVWQNALLTQTMTPNEYWSWIHKLYGSDLGLDDDELPSDYVEPVEEDPSKDKETLKSRDTDEERQEELNVEPMDSAEDGELSKSEEEIQVGSQDSSERHSGSDLEESVDPLTLLDFEGKIILDETYNIPVDQLFTSVFTGVDPLYAKVLEANRSTDISTTEWKTEEDVEERTFLHNMLISTGLTTKKCAVVETYSAQKCWLKPGRSYLLATSVQNKGVPYSDYFVVRLGHALTAVDSTRSHLRITLSVDFHKNPIGLMKNLIERGTESGVRQNKELLDKLIRTHLEKPHKRKKTRKKTSLEVPKREVAQPSQRMKSPPVISAIKWVLPRKVSTQLEFKSLHINTIILISIGLFVLLVLNVYLFLQLRSMYSVQTKYPSIPSEDVMQSIQSLPEESREWLLLLHQQQQYHELEMKKWREIMAMSVNLMKQIEHTFEELQSGLHASSSIPDLAQLIMDMQKNMANKGGTESKNEL